MSAQRYCQECFGSSRIDTVDSLNVCVGAIEDEIRLPECVGYVQTINTLPIVKKQFPRCFNCKELRRKKQINTYTSGQRPKVNKLILKRKQNSRLKKKVNSYNTIIIVMTMVIKNK